MYMVNAYVDNYLSSNSFTRNLSTSFDFPTAESPKMITFKSAYGNSF